VLPMHPVFAKMDRNIVIPHHIKSWSFLPPPPVGIARRRQLRSHQRMARQSSSEVDIKEERFPMSFWIARDGERVIRSVIRFGTKLVTYSPISARLLSAVAMFACVSFGPASAQECTDCKIPPGYTPLRGVSKGQCHDQLVACICNGVKSQQDLCLYVVAPGGNLHSVVPPPTANTQSPK
jgi:hypothetical protein